MTDSASVWFSASSALHFIYSIGAGIALLVAALSVRRKRPDAFGFILGASLLGIANVVLAYVVRAVLAVSLRSSGGRDSFAVANFVETAFSCAVGTLAVVLLVIGIMRLARPVGEDPAARAFAEGRYS